MTFLRVIGAIVVWALAYGLVRPYTHALWWIDLPTNVGLLLAAGYAFGLRLPKTHGRK